MPSNTGKRLLPLDLRQQVAPIAVRMQATNTHTLLQFNKGSPLPSRVELTSCSTAQPPQCTGCTCRGPHGSHGAIIFVSAAETECHPSTKLRTGQETSCRGKNPSLDESCRTCAQPEDLAANLTNHACIHEHKGTNGCVAKKTASSNGPVERNSVSDELKYNGCSACREQHQRRVQQAHLRTSNTAA